MSITIALSGGPLNGTTTTIPDDPWPRESWIYEPNEGERYTYFRDSADTTEPYSFTWYEVTDFEEAEVTDEFAEIPETQELLDPTGAQGEQGLPGAIGPPGEDGTDGVNFEFWQHPRWVYYLSRGLWWDPEYDTPLSGWDQHGWPRDMVPGDPSHGVIDEPGEEHFFDEAEIEKLNRDRALAAIGGSDWLNDFPYLRLPPGWVSPSRKGRWMDEDWAPGYSMWTEFSSASEPRQTRDAAGFYTAGQPDNPRWSYTTPHIHVEAWRFRGLGAKVQVRGLGSIQDDPYVFFTRDSIDKHPNFPSDWSARAGRESHPFAPHWGPYTGRMKMVYLARLDPVFWPKHDQYFVAGTWNIAAIFDSDPRNMESCVFLVKSNGYTYLVDSGPTYWPFYYPFGYDFMVEWEVQNPIPGEFVITP